MTIYALIHGAGLTCLFTIYKANHIQPQKQSTATIFIPNYILCQLPMQSVSPIIINKPLTFQVIRQANEFCCLLGIMVAQPLIRYFMAIQSVKYPTQHDHPEICPLLE